ncbi:exodeoxyribonuclease X [Pantoea sp. At-9b]|uniref:exodeoxyribonuclease X n=1 Tax=Pantoea sp. (strain At-9b) TaxID=592316 RepID=UPI0001B3F4FD|nr:exodeoxyribonuclease X [Pantoea sp. At-9b]ADU69465.1 DNA polymerase III, epsilon subunit [Pantoea sp. At-9b]
MSTIIRVIDTETTSFEGGICELASVDIVEGKICNPMSDFVKPPEPITVGAMAIHHITNDMVTDAPPIGDVIDRYLGADVYVAHNAAFDRPKLPQITAPWICTLKLARKLYPELESHTNQYLRYHFMLDVDVPEGLHAHRALYDCYVTAALLIRLNRDVQLTIAQMRDISSRPSLLHTMRFGKHKGKTFEEIAARDQGYLRWALGNMDLDEDQKFTMQHYLEG